MSHFKDLFSKQSSDYAKFRPTYPEALFTYLASLVDRRETAWDVGTGNGQAARLLGEHFARVYATDPSAKQIESAPAHPRVEYAVGTAEKFSGANESIDLITVAQAFHWFRREEFSAEANRVLRPGGVLALWSYALAKITPEVDAVVLELYEGVLGPYWEKERRLVEEGYRSVKLPFAEIKPPAFEMRIEWSLEHLVGYLGTWSALQTYIKKNGSNPLEEYFPRLESAWGSTPKRVATWDLALRVGRK
jgi:ubiquinone/menaquinone biosynthesis C-methylase UbiE